MKTVKDLRELLCAHGLLAKDEAGSEGEEREITWVTYDSREVRPGAVFLCKGAAFKADYLRAAIDAGCAAYVAERGMMLGKGVGAKGGRDRSVPGFLVTDIRLAMAVIAADFFGYVPGEPVLTGITGTKGKTTTAWYLKGMLDAWEKEQGRRETGLISSVENYDGKKREDAVMTTPEATVLHEYLAEARACGLPYVTMEVSSQALKYKRVRGLKFQVGIFTNISEDHISPAEHADFEDYFSSKLSLFRQCVTACVNLDADRSGRILRAARKAERVVTFGRSPLADIRCTGIHRVHGKLVFRVECRQFCEEFCLAMRGEFNVENALAAIAAAAVYGVPVRCMKEALASVQVPGRMETFYSLDGKICGVVDYAHNRLSFERLFDAVCQEYPQYRRIVTVFGCPGGKAFGRRRDLGLLAGLFSDKVYLTMDDPLMERVEDIAGEIAGYVEMVGCSCECIEDREQAICAAVSGCGEEKTLVLVLGKGSEKYQKIGGKAYRYPTDAQLLGQAIREYDGWRKRLG